MTVEELIARLADFPNDMVVAIDDCDYMPNGPEDVTHIREEDGKLVIDSDEPLS